MIKTYTNQQGKQFVFVGVPENITSIDVLKSNEIHPCYSIGSYFSVHYKYSSGEYAGGGFCLLCKDLGYEDKYPKNLNKVGLAKDFTDDECSDLGIDLLGLLLLALGFKETDNVLILEVLQ